METIIWHTREAISGVRRRPFPHADEEAADLAPPPPVSNDATRDEELDMRTTVTLDENLLAKAAEVTGRTEKSTLLRMGLEALVERESAKRLSLLGGSDPSATAAPRSR